jgi:hypothetical protein
VPDPLVSGCTIVRSGVGFDYPLVESLRSQLPLVKELVVVVQRGDAVLERVRALNDPRVVVVESDWGGDPAPGARGAVLARQTNLALARCRHPWVLYLQADEVLHEDDYGALRAALARYDGVASVDALWFRFLHFEGSYEYVNAVRYRRQCRLVRNDGRLESVRDAAGFARRDGRRLRTRASGARVFHYGWALAPAELKAKTLALATLYHGRAAAERRWGPVPPEQLGGVDLAFRWKGRHPAVMAERLARRRWPVPAGRRPPLDTPILNPRFYGAWLRKWGILPRW